MITHCIVSARLDYCKSLLSGTSGGSFDWLQVGQSALASSVTELSRSLHWLPIRKRVEYKLAVITYNTIQTNTPSTLASLLDSYRPTRTLRSSDKYSLLDSYRPTRTLRSSDKHLLSQPFIKLSLATKAFSVNAPSVWKNVSLNCRSSESLSTFKRRLKTELFTAVYGNDQSA